MAAAAARPEKQRTAAPSSLRLGSSELERALHHISFCDASEPFLSLPPELLDVLLTFGAEVLAAPADDESAVEEVKKKESGGDHDDDDDDDDESPLFDISCLLAASTLCEELTVSLVEPYSERAREESFVGLCPVSVSSGGGEEDGEVEEEGWGECEDDCEKRRTRHRPSKEARIAELLSDSSESDEGEPSAEMSPSRGADAPHCEPPLISRKDTQRLVVEVVSDIPRGFRMKTSELKSECSKRVAPQHRISGKSLEVAFSSLQKEGKIFLHGYHKFIATFPESEWNAARHRLQLCELAMSVRRENEGETSSVKLAKILCEMCGATRSEALSVLREVKRPTDTIRDTISHFFECHETATAREIQEACLPATPALREAPRRRGGDSFASRSACCADSLSLFLSLLPLSPNSFLLVRPLLR